MAQAESGHRQRNADTEAIPPPASGIPEDSGEQKKTGHPEG
jgi:hypothetical protein